MSTPRKSFKTPKGTELPLLSLKGREYLQVAYRLVWFREQHPGGILKTQMIAMNGEGANEYAVFKTEVFVDSERGPLMVASAHKKETRGGFDDFIEKAETGSIGRALALAGFGTQFAADELDEKDRLADSPLPSPIDLKQLKDDVKAKIAEVVAEGATAKRSSFRKAANVATPAGDDI